MMQATMTAVVTGVKRSKGEMEGRAYDSTKIYVQMPMDQTQGNAVGMAGAEFNWGTSENFAKVAGIAFPFQAELTIETVTNGKTMKQVVVDVQPIKTGKQAAT